MTPKQIKQNIEMLLWGLNVDKDQREKIKENIDEYLAVGIEGDALGILFSIEEHVRELKMLYEIQQKNVSHYAKSTSNNKFILQACESINRRLDEGVVLKYISYDNEELPHRVCFFVNGVQSKDIILSVEQFKSIDFMVELGNYCKLDMEKER